MSRARSVRVERTRTMGQHGGRRGVTPTLTSHCASPETPDDLLCKQGVVGSSPISSTAVTRGFALWSPPAPGAEHGLRVGCASAAFA